eukprot:TRINITY_DN31253_c0_g1_i1.p1 TRINITY_DN31253_c0_g1~~TRINITY_DN31253_c0_g1_i1.p1  ORF type:complete len:190 (+),score=49.11 TRINITY_DN31253_c0_g1_i1:74-571(+)
MRTAFALAAAFACATACTPPDCDHVDLGTCVQACCKLSFDVQMSVNETAAALGKSFQSGGPDGRYVYWGTVPDQGPLTFVVQGKHWTAKRTYVDSLSFGVYASADGKSTTVEGFSHSQDFIKGDFAYGDRGQNYKNLVELMGKTFSSSLKGTPEVIFGCPAPKGH